MRFFWRWMRELRLTLRRDVCTLWRLLVLIPRVVWSRYRGTVIEPGAKDTAAQRRKHMRQLRRSRSHSFVERDTALIDSAREDSSRARTPVFHPDAASLQLSSSSDNSPIHTQSAESNNSARFSSMMSYRAPESLPQVASPPKPVQSQALRDAMQIIHMGERELQVTRWRDGEQFQIEHISSDRIVIRKNDLWKLPFAILMRCSDA
jgi:hypothetical protein